MSEDIPASGSDDVAELMTLTPIQAAKEILRLRSLLIEVQASQAKQNIAVADMTERLAKLTSAEKHNAAQSTQAMADARKLNLRLNEAREVIRAWRAAWTSEDKNAVANALDLTKKFREKDDDMKVSEPRIGE